MAVLYLLLGGSGRRRHERELLLQGRARRRPRRGPRRRRSTCSSRTGASRRSGRGSPPGGAAGRSTSPGLVVCPGFIDIHVHLREPGREDKETIATGTRGGGGGRLHGRLRACPTPTPSTTRAAVTACDPSRRRAPRRLVRVYPIGAITKGSKGEELARVRRPASEAGCVARLRRRPAGRRAPASCGGPSSTRRPSTSPSIDHCEDPTLAAGGVDERGAGLDATSACAAARRPPRRSMVARDVLLAELTGGRGPHRPRLAPPRSVDAIRRGKARGRPRHRRGHARTTSLLTDEAVRHRLRHQHQDEPAAARRGGPARRCSAGCATGPSTASPPTTPRTRRRQEGRVRRRPRSASSGLETAVPLCLDRLVGHGLARPVPPGRPCSRRTRPACSACPAARSRPARPRDVTVLDLRRRRRSTAARFESRGRNTPFAGWNLRGWPAMTIVGGRIVWKDAGQRRPAADRPRYNQSARSRSRSGARIGEALRERLRAPGVTYGAAPMPQLPRPHFVERAGVESAPRTAAHPLMQASRARRTPASSTATSRASATWLGLPAGGGLR